MALCDLISGRWVCPWPGRIGRPKSNRSSWQVRERDRMHWSLCASDPIALDLSRQNQFLFYFVNYLNNWEGITYFDTNFFPVFFNYFIPLSSFFNNFIEYYLKPENVKKWVPLRLKIIHFPVNLNLTLLFETRGKLKNILTNHIIF